MLAAMLILVALDRYGADSAGRPRIDAGRACDE